MDYLIRSAAKKDADTVYRFICLLEECSFDYNAFASAYNKNTGNSDCIYLVAEKEDETVIGFISCHIQFLLHHGGRVAEIQELYIDDTCRNNGIGKALLIEMEKRLLESTCLSFEVTAQNKRIQTHRFYENNGFVSSHKKFVKPLSSQV